MPDKNTENSLHQDIVRYYEICDTDYEFFWHLKSRMAMHYGYWDANTKNLSEALWNMNAALAERARIDSDSFVLDAGCGIGGSSIYLTSRLGCRTHGITLSEKHTIRANENARTLQLDQKCSFSVADFCNTNLASATYDVVWALESVCHAADKKAFVQEAMRLLKPGGRLVVGDFFQKENLSSEQNQSMQRWAESWAVPFFETGENFKSFLEETGFTQIRMENVDKKIAKSVAILNRYFLPGLLSNWLMPLFGKRKNKVQQLNVWSTRHQYKTFKKGLWNYLIVTAQKPEC